MGDDFFHRRKIGCTPETMQRWVMCEEMDNGMRSGLTSEERISSLLS